MRSLIEYLNTEQRLFFYCDLHAHPGKKGCFFYGNAIDDFVMQVIHYKLVKNNLYKIKNYFAYYNKLRWKANFLQKYFH